VSRWVRRRRPGTLGLLALMAVAWAALLAAYASGHGDWFDHDRLARGLAGWTVLAGFALMALAMMGPSCLPLAGYVSANTLRPRPAVAWFFACYLLPWLAFMLAFTAADTTTHALAGEGTPAVTGAVAAAAFAAAAAWQLSRRKRNFVLACRSVDLLPARGGAACRRLGLRQGAACVGACGPMMLATMAAPYGRPLWMALLAALTYLEKAARYRRRLARPSAAVLVSVGMAYLAVGVR